MPAPEMHRSNCPHCSKGILIRPDQVGRRLKCPTCKRTFTVDLPPIEASTIVVTDDNLEWQQADNANEIVLAKQPQVNWPKPKAKAHFDRDIETVYRAVVLTVRNMNFDIHATDQRNFAIQFGVPDDQAMHDVRLFEGIPKGTDFDIAGNAPNVDEKYSQLYEAVIKETGKYLMFASEVKANKRRNSDDDEDRDDRRSRRRSRFECRVCRSDYPPVERRKVSVAGWVLFGCMAGFFFLSGLFCLGLTWFFIPLCLLGLLITESELRCPNCGSRAMY
jgi:DNA-directed RNA polymerase subunit M/transcription elongation factor TFIIS